MNWRQMQADKGLTEKDYTLSVRKRVKEYLDYEEWLPKEREKLEAADSDTKKKRIQTQITTVENAMLRLNEKLCKDMVRLADPEKKKHYETLKSRLKPKGAKATAAAATTTAATSAGTAEPVNNEPAQTAPAQTPAASTTATPAAQQPAATKPKATTTAAPDPAKTTAAAKPKKKNNSGLIFGIVVSVLTLGTVGYVVWKRNR